MEALAAVPVTTWFVLGALLALSGMFSATETALFSLAPDERAHSSDLVKGLLKQPRDLLVTVLFGNLVVNLLFFAAANGRLKAAGVSEAGIWIGALLAVLICGEILPKTIGLRMAPLVAGIGAVPLLGLVRALGPLRRYLTRLLEWFHGLTGERMQNKQGLSTEDLARALERSADRGLLLDSEADLLGEIIELDGMRVREIMTPRVDLLFLEGDGSNREEALAMALERRMSWLPVMQGSPDNSLGCVRVRDLVNQPQRPLAQMIMPIKFVPEVASCLSLLHAMRDDRVEEALVVDEWGGTAGVVTIEDLFEEIVGDLRMEEERREHVAVPLGEGLYRVDGSLSIRDWNDEFGTRIVPAQFETVGGFVTALLGRIPRVGDEVQYGPLEMIVHEVRGRRVRAVDLRVIDQSEVSG